jgi:WD40 repeat protein
LNKRAILGCDDGCIRIFDIESGAELKTINAHKSAIKKVAVSSKTGDILSAAYDQQIIIWDAHTFELKVQLEEQRSKWERSFSWTPDGTGILAGTFDGTVLHWDAKDGKLLNEVGEKGGNDCLNDVSADSNGAIATVNDAGFIRLGEVQTDASRWYSKTAPAAGRMLMNAVTMDAQLNVVVAGAHNMQLHIYDKVGHELMNEITVDLNEGPVNCIRISHIPGHEAIFVACYSGAIVKLSREGEILTKFHVHENAVKALRIHPTEAIGVSCSADGVLVSWDLDGNLLREYKGHMAIIDDVDLDPTGAYIASTGRDFTMKVFNLKSGEMVHSVSLGRRSPKGICFYDADTVIVTNYWGELIRITLSTEESLTKQIARNGISAIDRCGENVVAVSYCGAAILVNPADLTTINTLRAMTQRVDETEYV